MEKILTQKITTKQMAFAALFTTLTAIGAFIKIPIPVVPFTLQFLFTMMAGLLLGGKLGSLSVLVYMFIGLAGIPVFTEGGGIGYLLKPSFGYIIGFVIAAYVNGSIVERMHKVTVPHIIFANFMGLIVVYTVGMVYYYIICNYVINSPIAVWPLFLYCFILAVPGDICLCFLSAFLAKKLRPVIMGYLEN